MSYIGPIMKEDETCDDCEKIMAEEEEQKTLNAKLDQYEAELRELAQQFTPDIEGLEIELGNSIDNKRQMGVYYKGTNIAFLSESELWDLC